MTNGITITPESLFKERLRVPEAFLNAYSDVVRDKFLEAAEKFERGTARADAINQCLHLASSVVLRNPEHLDEALDTIRGLQHKPWKVSDPGTLLTVAMIYYLLQYVGKSVKIEKTRTRLNLVQERFKAEEWLIGQDAMRGLGIV